MKQELDLAHMDRMDRQGRGGRPGHKEMRVMIDIAGVGAGNKERRLRQHSVLNW
jgi:hypothetical protein